MAGSSGKSSLDQIEQVAADALLRAAVSTQPLVLNGTATRPGIFKGRSKVALAAAELCLTRKWVEGTGEFSGRGKLAREYVRITSAGIEFARRHGDVPVLLRSLLDTAQSQTRQLGQMQDGLASTTEQLGGQSELLQRMLRRIDPTLPMTAEADLRSESVSDEAPEQPAPMPGLLSTAALKSGPDNSNGSGAAPMPVVPVADTPVADTPTSATSEPPASPAFSIDVGRLPHVTLPAASPGRGLLTPRLTAVLLLVVLALQITDVSRGWRQSRETILTASIPTPASGSDERPTPSSERGSVTTAAIPDTELKPLEPGLSPVDTASDGWVPVKCLVADAVVLWSAADGEVVAAGDEILRLSSPALDDRIYRQRIAVEATRTAEVQARLQLTLARLALESLPTENAEQRHRAEAAVLAARQQVASRETLLLHTQRMARRGYAPPTVVTAHELAVQQSAAELQAAEAARDRMLLDTPAHDRAVLEARSHAAEQLVALTSERTQTEAQLLSDLQTEHAGLVVRAPVGGTVRLPANSPLQVGAASGPHRGQLLLHIVPHAAETPSR